MEEAIGNAIDHTEGECALVVLACYQDRVVVDVTDCGCGFELEPDEDTPQVTRLPSVAVASSSCAFWSTP